jgi:predicted phosphodiesterase
MTDTYLVFGDNHGDTESLERVLDDTADEQFEYAVHVGDFTRAYRDAKQAGENPKDPSEEITAQGGAQLEAVEPLLERFDERATHGLLWVYGNQEYFGEVDYDLSVGTEVPDDGTVTVGDQRFTNDPEHVDSDTILVTHMERWALLDHFDGRAHFCGNSHRGRYRDHKLNTAMLKSRNPETGELRRGGYFLAEVDESGIVDVEMRTVGCLRRVECGDHRERGVQFQPEYRDCMYCAEPPTLLREMAASAYYGLTGAAVDDSGEHVVTREEIVEHAMELWDDPPADLRAELTAYLGEVDEDRYGPLASTDDGNLTLAGQNYCY